MVALAGCVDNCEGYITTPADDYRGLCLHPDGEDPNCVQDKSKSQHGGAGQASTIQQSCVWSQSVGGVKFWHLEVKVPIFAGGYAALKTKLRVCY